MTRHNTLYLLTTIAGAALLTACVGIDAIYDPPVSPNPIDPVNNPDNNRTVGATSFVSADGYAGQDSGEKAPSADEDGSRFAGTADDSSGTRTVEEGDIYRVLAGNLIANLNAYRGLQIIDFSNVNDPKITGRLQISGTPVEMYVVGDTAYLLMNNWYGYYGGLYSDASVTQWYGGVAVAVDITDPTHPTVINRATIPGNISTSRITYGGGASALYVVTSGWFDWDNDGSWETQTVVKSFDITNGALVEKTELNLGGYVTDIQATTDVLIVARYNWNGSGGSDVSLIDISDPAGTMVEGAQINVAGYVASQFNMDLHNGILRVVSGASWNGSSTNHLQTYDAGDIYNLVAIDDVTFGANQQLYATLFLADKAFFVTYLRIDPFHAFSIDGNGFATEVNEFVVSGWNDFFRPVSGDSRLIGIGVNDDASRTLAVSLYDITNLANPTPLIQRVEVEADYSWSEANWDHRAFSVIENAVNITGPNGEQETGLVLLPFSGWSDSWQNYTAAVQVFTFSDTSLTQRDVMVHGTPVRRSFLADTNITANLSEAELSLFDTSNPAQVTELGRLELAPNYTDFLPFGSYAARVKNSRDYYYYWWGGNTQLPNATVEIISRSVHPDEAPAVAMLEVPAEAQIYKSGDNLIAVTTRTVDTSSWPYTYETDIEIHDLSDPTNPQLAAAFTTDRIQPRYNYWGWGLDDCWECGARSSYWVGYGNDQVETIPNGLVFLQREQHSELLGTETVCRTYADVPGTCDWYGNEDCTYYYGSVTCRSMDGDPAYCTGNIQRCDYSTNGNWSCTEVDASTIATSESCYDYERYRYWQSFNLEVLNLTTAASPSLTTIEMPDEQQGVSILANGADIWMTYSVPFDVPGDSRPYVQYFIQRVGLANPALPLVHTAVNVPGELIAIDAATVFTRDLTWGPNIAETSLAKLQLVGNTAQLSAVHTFSDQWVESLVLDGAGHVLANHRNHWSLIQNGADNMQHLTVLDAVGSLTTLSDSIVDTWASLRDAKAGRALFSVPGGILVFNLDDPATPFAQSFFPTRGWPQQVLVDNRDIILPAGRFGIYAFDLDEYNLLSPSL